MLAGVTIVDPGATWIEAEVEIAADVRIEPGCSLIGASSIGAGSVIGPHTTLIDARIGDEVTVPHSYLLECDVGDRCKVGPFAYLRPKAELGEGAKAGTFVEIKNSKIGHGSKVPHLSYIGDADVGEGTNLGAATITANYDGTNKHRTKIGDRVRTSVDTTLVAPVTIGDDAYTGAGSVITEDVPPGALAIAQTRAEEHRGLRRPEGEGEGSQVSNGDTVSLTHPPSELEPLEDPYGPSSIKQDYTKRLMVFGGRASGELAAKIAGHLDVDLGQVDLRTFANGEVYCRYERVDPRRRRLHRPVDRANEKAGMTPNDALMELLCMIDAAQGASAHRIIAVMPWYGYARQDKKSQPREPITARIVAKVLEEIGVDRVLTMDLHAGQVQGFFHVPVDHMTAMPMLTQWFIDQNLKDDLVIVSPDAGRVKVARNFARKVGTHWAVMEKERPAQQVAEIGYVVGDVKGKTAVLVDDMIDTAGTLCAAAETVLRGGRRPRDRLRHPRRLQRPRLRAPRLRELGDRADRRHRHGPAAPRRARQHHRPVDRQDPRRLDPADLHRRFSQRDLRRREPALLRRPVPMDRSTLEWYEMLARGLIWLAAIVMGLAVVGAVVIAGSDDSLGLFTESVDNQARGVGALVSLGGGLTASGVLAGLGAILRLHVADHMQALPPEVRETPTPAPKPAPAKPRRKPAAERPRSKSSGKRSASDRKSGERERE